MVVFNYFLFVVTSGTNNEVTHAYISFWILANPDQDTLIIDFFPKTFRLSVILVSRMIFNLREAGTEIHEGTMEWHSRIEREGGTTLRFCVPTTDSSDFWHNDSEGGNGGAEIAHEHILV